MSAYECSPVLTGRADEDNGNDLNDSMYSVRQSAADSEGLVDRLRTLADSDADRRRDRGHSKPFAGLAANK